MQYREMAETISEEDIRILFSIAEPDGIFIDYKKEEDFIRVSYYLPGDDPNTNIRQIDLLPDEAVLVEEDNENKYHALQIEARRYQYLQFTVAKGYSYLLRNNPYL